MLSYTNIKTNIDMKNIKHLQFDLLFEKVMIWLILFMTNCTK